MSQQLNPAQVKDVLYRIIDKINEQDVTIASAEVEKYFTQALAELRRDTDEPQPRQSKRLTTKDLPERLTNSAYGSEQRKKRLAANAKTAPPIEEIWKISERLPSFTKLLLEGRE